MTIITGPSVGFDRRTGAVLVGWPHVVQCLEVTWTTGIGERVIREWFGSPALRLLGENMTPANVLLFWNVLKIVTDLWEPRFSIVHVGVMKTTPEEGRQGSVGFTVRGIYRPRGHAGDMAPERERTVLFNGSDVENL